MSKIEWLARPGTIPVSWNPVTGCTPISPGCAHCYARRMARRLAGRHGYPPAPNEFDVTLHPERLGEPQRWKKPRTVFVNSMSDLFHQDVPSEFIVAVYEVMAACPQHTFIVATKRADRMYGWAKRLGEYARTLDMVQYLEYASYYEPPAAGTYSFPLSNVWGLVTVEDQDHVWRIEQLVKTPFAVRGVSLEPLLSPVNLGLFGAVSHSRPYSMVYDRLNWVIVGGETGPGARPPHPDWIRLIRDQCLGAGVPFFFKSWGNWAPHGLDNIRYTPHHENGRNFAELHYPGWSDVRMVNVGKKRAGRLLDGQTWDQWPG